LNYEFAQILPNPTHTRDTSLLFPYSTLDYAYNNTLILKLTKVISGVINV